MSDEAPSDDKKEIGAGPSSSFHGRTYTFYPIYDPGRPEKFDREDARSVAESADLETQAKQAHVKGLNQDIELRETISNRLYWLMVGTLIAGLILIVWAGFPDASCRLALSETVQVSVIAAITIKVIGLYFVVTRSVFPNRDRGDQV